MIIIGRHIPGDMFSTSRCIICIQLSIDESDSEFWFSCTFWEVTCRAAGCRQQDFLHTAFRENHICLGTNGLGQHSPLSPWLPDQVWRNCRAVTPHGFLQVSYLVPICVDILPWLFFFPSASLECIYLSAKPQFGFKTCLLRVQLNISPFVCFLINRPYYSFIVNLDVSGLKYMLWSSLGSSYMFFIPFWGF